MVSGTTKIIKILGMAIPISFLIGLGVTYLYAKGGKQPLFVVSNKFGEHNIETILVAIGIIVLFWYLFDEIRGIS